MRGLIGVNVAHPYGRNAPDNSRQALSMTATNGYWSRIARERLSRRRALAAGVSTVAGAVALATVGCGDGKSASSTTPAAEAPRPGGTLRTATSLPIASGLDPQIETGTGLGIFPRVYGYMLHVDPADESVIYDHAVSVEQTDAMTYVFKLKPDIKFQSIAPVNGRAVTSEDIARSLARYRNNPLVPSKTWHATILDRVETPDATTVRVITKRPYAYTLQELGGISAGAIIPRELVDAETNLSAAGVGSGPFQIERAAPGDDVRLVRNANYYRAPVPYLDAMEWQVAPSDDVRFDAFRQRQADVMPNRDKHEAQMARDISESVHVTSEPALAWVALGLRCDRPPFNDPRVRGALDLALDRDTLIRDLSFGDGDVLGAVNPHLAAGYWSLPQADVIAAQSGGVDLAERRANARALLLAAGADKARFTLQVAAIPQLIDVATVVRQHLLTLGLDIVLQELDLIAWFTNFHGGKFEATLISHLPYESPDTPTRFYHSAGPDGTSSPFGFSSGDIDRLVERSWGEKDRATRQQTLLEAQKLMLTARPMIQLLTNVGYTSAWDYVRNRREGLVGSLAQYNYEQWLALH